jgi:hypothetical protein
MKARITTVFATAVVALAVAGGALAAPHQSTVKGSDYAGYDPFASTGWTSYNPFASTGWTSYNPLRTKPANITARSVHGWSLRPAFNCCKVEV